MNQVLITIPEDRKYLLFGETASRIYYEEGSIDNILKDKDISYAIYQWDGDVDDLLSQMEGWFGYAWITKNEYNKLLKHES